MVPRRSSTAPAFNVLPTPGAVLHDVDGACSDSSEELKSVKRPSAASCATRRSSAVSKENLGLSIEEEDQWQLPPSFSDLIHEVETALSGHLADYRARAEETLALHLEALQNAQKAQDKKLAEALAENSAMRLTLGLNPQETQQQSIVWQGSLAAVATPTQSKRKRTCTVANKEIQRPGPLDESLFDAGKKLASKGSCNNAGFGTWQSFMAWVPGEAPLQGQQSWKPLQTGTIQSLDFAGAKLNEPTSPARWASPSSFTPGRAASHPASFPRGHMPAGIPVAPMRTNQTKEDDTASSENDESTFRVLDLWEASDQLNRKMNTYSAQEMADKTPSSVAFQEEDSDPGNTRAVDGCIMDPDSKIRLFWDLTGLLMICYDVIMIPMLTFDLADSPPLNFMDWATRLFWTFDMGMTCCTGLLLPDGKVDYSRRNVLIRYLKSWFGLDVFIVGSDWLGVLVSSGSASLSRLARMSRMARSLRLLRLVRMREIMAKVTEHLESQSFTFLAQALRAAVLMVTFSHYVACGWWGLGVRDAEQLTWVRQNSYELSGLDAKYLVSMHWAWSQFVGGMDEIKPESALERFYALAASITCFMISLLVACSLTSSLCQTMIIGGKGPRQMAQLKIFLRQNCIPKNLSMRLCRNALHSLSGHLMEDSVELLSAISEPLHMQMRFAMYSRILSWHPFFADLLNEKNSLLRKITSQAMSMLQLAEGDVVFSRDEEAEPTVYFVVAGKLGYVDAYGEEALVTEHDYVSEAVMWTDWKHEGDFIARSNVKLALLHVNVFHDICRPMMSSAKTHMIPVVSYAQKFVADLNAAEDRTDLAF